MVIGRHAAPAQLPSVIGWEDAAQAIDGADIVINLAGRSVNCRYTRANRLEILDSRVDTTRAIGDAIAAAVRPPRVWLQMSTATIYSHRYDAANDEVTGIIGGDEPAIPSEWRFSIEVAKAWEDAADEKPLPLTRVVKMRTAMVMSPYAGGPFTILCRLARLGLGGTFGNGRQYMSWIHHRDFVRAVLWLINGDLEGVVNIASPNPVTNKEFMRVLRRAAGMPFAVPAPKWVLEVAARFHRTETELLLKSRRVVPLRLTDSGFTFQFSTWTDAARTLVAEWRSKRNGKNLRSVRLALRSVLPRTRVDEQSAGVPRY